MLMGIRYRCYPTPAQADTLAQWIGCARSIWNAKCDENQYLRTFAKKYMPVGTYPDFNKKYAIFKDSELTPWLFDCPPEIMRGAGKIWYDTQVKAIKGQCGFPKRKNRSKGNSIWVTEELFRFEEIDGCWRLWIGPVSKTNPKEAHTLGYLNVKFHRKPTQLPKSLRIKCRHNRFTVSFCYDDNFDERQCLTDKQNLNWLKKSKQGWLEQYTVGIDRGVARAIQANGDYYHPTESEARKHKSRERYTKRYQRKMAKQKKGSNRRLKTCRKISRLHEKTKNVRDNFLHNVTRVLVDNPEHKIFILEDLKLKNMTRKPKPKKDPNTGKWLANKASAKAGLNKALLSQGLYQFEVFLKYKARRELKPVFKINPYQTSQECAACGHTHSDNRKNQALFVCQQCGNIDNADHNAAKVIKKRAIKLFLDSGTELSKRGVLIPLDSGRGAKDKTRSVNTERAPGCETSKKKSTTSLVIQE